MFCVYNGPKLIRTKHSANNNNTTKENTQEDELTGKDSQGKSMFSSL